MLAWPLILIFILLLSIFPHCLYVLELLYTLLLLSPYTMPLSMYVSGLLDDLFASISPDHDVVRPIGGSH